VLAHPAGEIPFLFVGEEALQLIGPVAKCVPPGVDACWDALACIVLFRISPGVKYFQRIVMVSWVKAKHRRARRYRAIPSSAWLATA